MSRSEIFESFVKIAQEKGLISDEKPTNERVEAEHTEKDFHETNPRHDSLSIEQISKLYNTKPATPKEMEYKRNISELAHPDLAVLFQAHDKLNGLVESENQGQDIRIHISLKEPDGHLINRKYAQDALIKNLVRVANDLDNRDQEELRKLADACLSQASSTFRKVAFPFVIVGIAAAVGVLYAKQHLRFHSDGFMADYQKAVAEIDDLLQSNTTIQTSVGAGYEYTPAFLQTVQKLKDELAKLAAGMQKLLPILDKIETPHTGEELKQLAAQPVTQEAHQALVEFMQTMEEVYPFINKTITDFANEGYKQRAVSQKGWMSSLLDATEVLHGGGGLVADDFDDVKHALQTVKVDVDNIVKGLQGAESEQQSAQQQLQAVQTEETGLFQSTRPESGGTEGGAPQKPEERGPLADLEESGKGLLGSMLGK